MTSRAPSRPRAVSDRSAVPRMSRSAASSSGSSGNGPSPGIGAPSARKYSSSAVNAITRSESSPRRRGTPARRRSLSASRHVPSMWNRSLVCPCRPSGGAISSTCSCSSRSSRPSTAKLWKRSAAGRPPISVTFSCSTRNSAKFARQCSSVAAAASSRSNVGADAIGADQQVHAEAAHVRVDEDAQAVGRLVGLPAVRQLDLERGERRHLATRVREARAQNSTRSEKYHSAAAPTPAPASTNAAST